MSHVSDKKHSSVGILPTNNHCIVCQKRCLCDQVDNPTFHTKIFEDGKKRVSTKPIGHANYYTHSYS
jgi:hypothetical protein